MYLPKECVCPLIPYFQHHDGGQHPLSTPTLTLGSEGRSLGSLALPKQHRTALSQMPVLVVLTHEVLQYLGTGSHSSACLYWS